MATGWFFQAGFLSERDSCLAAGPWEWPRSWLGEWVGRADRQVSFMCMSFYKYTQVRRGSHPETFCWWGEKKGITQEADSSKRFTTRLRYPSLPLISPWCYVKNKEFFKKINNGLMVQLLKLIRNSTFLLWLLIYNIHYVQIWWGNSECHEAGPCSLGVYPFWGALALM